MAHQVGMSRARFAARFRTMMDISPVQYLTCWPIALPQQQLLGGQSMKVIADAVRYDSPSAFARAFRRHQNNSPAA